MTEATEQKRINGRMWFDESVTMNDPHPGPGWEPSPDQIKAWTEEIQAGWPKSETSVRRGQMPEE